MDKIHMYVSMTSWSYASDIHLEYHGPTRPWPRLTPAAPYLALAGDIGDPRDVNYYKFLKWCSNRWKHVVVVRGNHEQWHQSPDECEHVMKAVCDRFDNVTFLDNDVVEIDGVRVFGATLWSNVTDDAARFIKDYAMIENLTPDKVRYMHQATVDHIEYLLDSSTKPLLCVTHHAPLLLMSGSFGTDSPVISAFCSDLSGLFRPPLAGWISGHTHSSTKTVLNNIPCESNCWGYDIKERKSFACDAVMTLGPEVTNYITNGDHQS